MRIKNQRPKLATPLRRKLHMPDGVWTWDIRTRPWSATVLIQAPDNKTRHLVQAGELLGLSPLGWEDSQENGGWCTRITPAVVRDFISDGRLKDFIEKDKTLKQYPSIPGRNQAPIGEKCIAFKKYDGSNLRFEYSRKKGWYKFGTRKRLFDKTDRAFGEAIELFQKTLAPGLEAVFKKHFSHVKSFLVFAEYFGAKSFAGKHLLADPKELVIIDIVRDRSGFFDPEDFLKYFGHLKVAEVVYEGRLTQDFTQDVFDGKYDVGEGVVCKGGIRHKLWRCKIKTKAYRERLKRTHKEGWEKFWE